MPRPTVSWTPITVSRGRATLHEARLDQPARWLVPRRVLACPKGDLLHPAVPSATIDRIRAAIAGYPRHLFDVRTAWPARLAALASGGTALPHLWIGARASNQDEVDARLPSLLTTPAALRTLTLDPLTGPVTLPEPALRAIGWVIAGNTGGGRVLHPDWIRSLRDQCAAARVPLTFTGWGHWAPTSPFEAAGSARAAYRGRVLRVIVGEEESDEYRLCTPTRDDDSLGPPLVLTRTTGLNRRLDGIEHDAMPEEPAP